MAPKWRSACRPVFPFLEAVRRFGAACDEAQIRYFLGGSAATAFQGEPRMTNDLDFVVDADAHQIERLAELLGSDFEVDLESLVRAARRRESWNIFFVPPGDFLKIDIFFLRGTPFDQSEFARRQPIQIGADVVWIKSPEDSVLRKLLWFQAGGAELDKQWRDVVMVLKLNTGRLDEPYLTTWAERLGLTALLDRARAGLPRP